MYTQIKIIYKKRVLLIGTLVWIAFLFIAFMASIEVKHDSRFFDNLLGILFASIFSIPFVIVPLTASLPIYSPAFGYTIMIILVFINSYLIVIVFNKLFTERSHYSKWLKYGLSYIGINLLIFFSARYLFTAWYLFILPTLKGFFKFF